MIPQNHHTVFSRMIFLTVIKEIGKGFRRSHIGRIQFFRFFPAFFIIHKTAKFIGTYILSFPFHGTSGLDYHLHIILKVDLQQFFYIC